MAKRLGKKFYKQILADAGVERNFCGYMQAIMADGSAASLINDDFGHWAIAVAGVQETPPSHNFNKKTRKWTPCSLATTFIIDAIAFDDTIGGALQRYAFSCL